MKKAFRPIAYIQIFLHILAFAFFGAAAIRAATSYQMNTGTTPTINEFGVCKVITNTSGKNLFIPTNSSGEWVFLLQQSANGRDGGDL